MTINTQLLRCPAAALFCLLLATTPAAAQRPDLRGGPPVATDTFSLAASFSGSSSLERSGANVGDISVTALQAGFGSSTAIGDDAVRLTYGVDLGRFALDRDPTVPLPDRLQEVVLPFGVGGALAPDWAGRVLLRPGVYGTSLRVAGSAVNVPVLALATWRRSAELTWSFGLRYDAWARHTLLPLAGVNWRFARAWDLAVGLPRTGVSWQFRPEAAVRLGATVQGGSFHVASEPRPPGTAGPALGDTKLDYREIRLGVALDLTGNDTWSVLADAGVIANQRFDYHRRHYRLSGDATAYAALSARARF